MKKFYFKIIKILISYLTSHYEKRKPKGKSNLPYNALMPTENAENVEDYLTSLDWALNNRKKIKNIAIAGAYGSGKSSVVQTFQKKNNKKYKFLNISLATFNEIKKVEDEDQENDTLRLIELSILQQLFYHEKDSKIPDSNFKKIKSITVSYRFLLTLGGFAFVISFLNIVFPDFLSKFVWYELTENSSRILYIISVFLVSLGSFYTLFKSIRLLKSFTIKKIGIGKTNIEIDNNISKSILNNHIDEILYFFEVTNYNVVIFEDLDRFEQTDVFTKLREVNLLIKNSKKVEQDVVFIYAIRDDLFHGKNRTKFFDFIIPIIPVINFSNSKEKLLDIVKTNEYTISTNLMDDISLFIDDMRLLYNIMNEYHIYSKKLSSTLNQDNLLSMIVYKNLYPDDFTKLNQNDGELYKVITSKRKYINEQINEIDDEILKIKSKVETHENVKLKNIKELRLLYISQLVEEIIKSGRFFRYFLIGHKQVHISKATDDSIFTSIQNQRTIQYVTHPNSASNFSYNFKNIESEIDANFTYQEREQLIVKNKQLDQLKQNIEKKELEKTEIKKYKLKNLVSDKKITIESGKENQKELISILLRSGYIDENYFHYISIFYEGSLSENDHQFLLNVKTQTTVDYDYSLQNKEDLISRIDEFDFEKEYILNYDLLDFLLSSNEYLQKRDRLFNQLTNESDSSFKFIEDFVETTENVELFIMQLCKKWVSIWGYIETKSNLPKEKINNYFKRIIEYAEADDIVNIFKDSKASISNNKDFLGLIEDTGKLKEIIKRLDIRFSTLKEEAPVELMDFIYSGNYYVINQELIKYILTHKNESFNESDFNSKNYSTIKQSKLEKLIICIEEDINEYLSSVYFKMEGSKNEEEDYFAELLNKKDVSFEDKGKIIALNTTVISDINKIEDLEIIKLLLNESKVVASWENLLKVYIQAENVLIKEIIHFINIIDNSVNLQKEGINKEFLDEERAEEFINSLLLKEEIDSASYDKVSLSLSSLYSYSSLKFENLSNDKVEKLINNGILIADLKTLNLLKTKFEVLHIQLIEKDIDNFIKDIDAFENEDILELLNSDILHAFRKIEIINNLKEDSINRKLLNKIGELLVLYNYSLLYPAIKNEPLIKLVLQDSNLSSVRKINLFNKNNSIYDNEDIDDFLNNIEEPYPKITQSGKRPPLDNNKTNMELVENLKAKNYISSFKIEGKKIKISTYRNRN